ncbi:hypothetical protein [Chryseobacterium sp. MFBS3-17]|uniref:hypothetical protein n=1 Tax=Chryseobacterium sp. MFBS3-17 TaxID=2886689 RepID=UPI001D0E4C2E|nr:hypothetical protein [Chryseobacterium sp. MFBS3-17]MCC2590338.1 hypothetical protein [Chryseobacterium sp. MFBS3-17]
MKVKIKTDPEALFLAHQIVMYQMYNLERQRSGKSMIIEIWERLGKLCMNYTANPNGKPRTVELRYHLAEKLLSVVTVALMSSRLGTYEANKLEMFKNDLHKVLL